MTEENYQKAKQKYTAISKEFIDLLVITTTDAKTSLRRDYLNSLALEPRSFLNLDNIEEYNNNLNKAEMIFPESVHHIVKVDTTKITPNETSIMIANGILPVMRKNYIKHFQETIKKEE